MRPGDAPIGPGVRPATDPGASSDQAGDGFPVGLQDLAAALGSAAHGNAGAQAQAQRLQSCGIVFLGGTEGLPAELRIEAVQIEEKSILAIGQETEHRLRALAGIQVTSAEHLTLQAEVFRAGRETHKRLGDIGRIEVGGDQCEFVGMHDLRVVTPARAVLVQFLAQFCGQRAAGLDQLGGIEGGAPGRRPCIEGAAADGQVEGQVDVGIGFP